MDPRLAPVVSFNPVQEAGGIAIGMALAVWGSWRLRPLLAHGLPARGSVYWGIIGAKLAAGLLLCSLYGLHYRHGDSLLYLQVSRTLHTMLVHNPVHAAQYLGSVGGRDPLPGEPVDTVYLNLAKRYGRWDVQDQMRVLDYYNRGNGLITGLLLYPLWLATGGSYWGGGLLASALAAWLLLWLHALLYRRMLGSTAAPPGQAWLLLFAVLLAPSSLLWAAGYTKDVLVMIAAAAIAIALLRLPARPARQMALLLGAALLGAGILMVLRPLWVLGGGGAGMLLLLHLALLRRLYGWAATLATAVLALALAWLLELTPWSWGYIVEHAQASYDYHLLHARTLPHAAKTAFELWRYPPTLWGLVSVLPLASVAAFLRPWPHECSIPLLPFALESAVLLLAAALAVRSCWRARGRLALARTLPWLYLLGFALVYGAFTAASTPVFGTLVRYRLSYMPLALLALAGLWVYARAAALLPHGGPAPAQAPVAPASGPDL